MATLMKQFEKTLQLRSFKYCFPDDINYINQK